MSAYDETQNKAETTTPPPTMPTSPLIRYSGTAAGETVSDSEIELGRTALRDVKHSIAASKAEVTTDSDIVMTTWTDISGFIRSVPGVGDYEETPLPAEDVESDADSDSGPDSEYGPDDHVVTDSEDDGKEATTDDDGDSAASDIDDSTTDVPKSLLQKEIAIDLPLWAWLTILLSFVAWVALVNGVLSRDLGCRPVGR